MRATLAMFVFVMGLFILTTADDIRNFRRFLNLRPRAVIVKHRTKLRDSRGFKPTEISTAYGFGKRFISKSYPKTVSGIEELTPDEALHYMISERLREILPENHSFIRSLRHQMEKINADKEELKEERKLILQDNEGNEEQSMVMDLL